jgi:hypothetical protein
MNTIIESIGFSLIKSMMLNDLFDVVLDFGAILFDCIAGVSTMTSSYL